MINEKSKRPKEPYGQLVAEGREGNKSHKHRQGPRGGWVETYEGVKPEDLPWFSPIPDPDLLTTLDKYAPKPGCALDLGCGPGIHAIVLAKRGWRVTALDIAPGAIRMAEQFAKQAEVEIDFRIIDILTYEPQPNSFDLVHDRGFLHTLDPMVWPKWVDLVATALRPGGLLIAKEFTYDPVRCYGPRGLTKSELRDILEVRFIIESIEKSRFPGRGSTRPTLLLIARRA